VVESRSRLTELATAMDEATAQLVRDAEECLGNSADGVTLYRELTRRNTRGPSMHRIDRVAIDTSIGAVPLIAYVPVPVPSGVILLLDRGPREGGNPWATESLARRIAERSSCEVVTADLEILGAEDRLQTVEAFGSIAQWCVTDRRLSEPPSTTAFVVVGHGAGGRIATHLMSASLYDDVGRHVDAWVLISPSLTSGNPVLDPGQLGEGDRPFAGMVAGLIDENWTIDVPSLAGDVAPQTSKVSAHWGGVLDPTREATAEFIDLLRRRGLDATSHEYTDQINGFFSIMSIPTGERTLQSLVRTVRAAVINAKDRGAEHE